MERKNGECCTQPAENLGSICSNCKCVLPVSHFFFPILNNCISAIQFLKIKPVEMKYV